MAIDQFKQDVREGRIDAERLLDVKVKRVWRLFGWLLARRGQLAVLTIDLETGDAVVAAIRDVQELSGRVDLDLGTGIRSLEVLGTLNVAASPTLNSASGRHRLLTHVYTHRFSDVSPLFARRGLAIFENV